MPVEIKYNGSTIANLEGGQTATLPCRGKKMKSDLTVIAPEGGGGECSGVHINMVDTLPEVGEEGAIYGIPGITDIIINLADYGVTLSMKDLGAEVPDSQIVTSEEFQTIEPTEGMMCYVTDVPEVYTYQNGEWVAFSTAEGGFYGNCLGELTGDMDTTVSGYYVVLDNALYKYEGGRYKKLVTKGGVKYTSNGDGTCKVSGIENYHDVELVIPSISPDGETVTGLGGLAFNGKWFKSLTIPSTITSFSDAFNNAYAEKLILEDGIKAIPAKAFEFFYCKEIVIPNSVTSIGNYAFQGCSRLTSLTIPESVTSIGDYVFDECTNLKYINFSGTVEQWNAISKDDFKLNRFGAPATIVKCADGEAGLLFETNFKYYGGSTKSRYLYLYGGMTWEQWVNCEYNYNGDFYIQDGFVYITAGAGNSRVQYNYDDVLATDIVKDVLYRAQYIADGGGSV